MSTDVCNLTSFKITIETSLGPYFPRLDHKLYDASSVNYRKELWTISLAYRLLQNEKNTLELLDNKSPVTPPPKYVRAILYNFRYTSKSDSGNGYWIRHKISEYFPAFSVDNVSLLAYLKSMKISPNYKEVQVENQVLKMILDFVRSKIHLLEGHFLILGVLAAGLVINVTKH